MASIIAEALQRNGGAGAGELGLPPAPPSPLPSDAADGPTPPPQPPQQQQQQQQEPAVVVEEIQMELTVQVSTGGRWGGADSNTPRLCFRGRPRVWV